MTVIQTQSIIFTRNNYILHLIDRPTLGDRLGQFLEILRRHEEDRDLIGVSLSNWGREVNLLIADDAEDLHAKIAEKINELQAVILARPIDGAPVENPVMMRNRLWDAAMLAHVREISFLDPFDLQPLEEGVPHVFAREMLAWAEDLITSFGDEEIEEIALLYRNLVERRDRTGWIDLVTAREEDRVIAAMNYCHLARDYLAFRENEGLAQLIHSANRDLETYIARVEEGKQVALRALQETLQRSSEASYLQLETIQAINHEIRSSLQEQLNQARQDLREKVASVEEENRRACAEMKRVKEEIAQCHEANLTNRRAKKNCIIS